MQQLKLFMYTAEQDAHMLKYQRSRFSIRTKIKDAIKDGIEWIGAIIIGLIKFAVITGLVIGVLFGTCKAVYRYNNADRRVASPKQDTPSKMIEATLIAVEREWSKGIDYSKDGELNCQDAAILFYRLYPDKANCGIESNSEMGHAFIVVRINGVYCAIEPQAYTDNKRPASYFMRDYCGSKYDVKILRLLDTSLYICLNQSVSVFIYARGFYPKFAFYTI
jgi:hypothetical protein